MLLTLLPLADIAGVEREGVSCGSKGFDVWWPVGEKSRYDMWLAAQASIGSGIMLVGLHASIERAEGVSGGRFDGSREGSKNSFICPCMSMLSIWLSRLGDDE